MASAPRKAYLSRNIERAGVWLWNNYLHKVEIGLLPKEYNFKVHGPYVPSRWYGKPETALKDVKLGELGAYFARRQKSPVAASREVGRLYHVWHDRFGSARYGNMSMVWQFAGFWMIVFALATYDRQYHHKRYRYHW